MDTQQLDWQPIIIALLKLQEESVISDEHHQFITEQFSIVSLYHQKFRDLNPLTDIQEELSELDTEKPKEYNMGRNCSSEFAFSRSLKYILKRISLTSFNYFRKILHQQYFQITSDRPTLLAQTYGVFCYESGQQKTYFILMENLFYYQSKQALLYIYDLKGAVANRQQKDFDQQFEQQQQLMQHGIYQMIKGKDQDFKKVDFFKNMEQKNKKWLFDKISQESLLLSQGNVMDYSLMIIANSRNDQVEDGHRLIVNGDLMVTMGIIDYFQEFNSTKKIECKLKSLFSRAKQDNQQSCVDSNTYQIRFRSYFQTLLSL